MLRLTIDELDDLVVFRCAGRIVAGEAGILRNAVLTQSRIRVAVLDLAEVSAVDAAGLGALLSLRRWAETTGAELKLLNLRPRVEKLLELTNLKSFFEVCSVRDVMDLWCRSFDLGAFAAGELSTGSQGRSVSVQPCCA